jgi:hypothetical protein
LAVDHETKRRVSASYERRLAGVFGFFGFISAPLLGGRTRQGFIVIWYQGPQSLGSRHHRSSIRRYGQRHPRANQHDHAVVLRSCLNDLDSNNSADLRYRCQHGKIRYQRRISLMNFNGLRISKAASRAGICCRDALRSVPSRPSAANVLLFRST